MLGRTTIQLTKEAGAEAVVWSPQVLARLVAVVALAAVMGEDLLAATVAMVARMAAIVLMAAAAAAEALGTEAIAFGEAAAAQEGRVLLERQSMVVPVVVIKLTAPSPEVVVVAEALPPLVTAAMVSAGRLHSDG